MSAFESVGQAPDATLSAYVADLYDIYGQRKSMSHSSPSPTLPHFFLLRTFLGENDLLVILNTKRCQYQCAFCRLPAKSSRTWISDDLLVAQFRHVADEMRHALSVVDRVTLSNEGSVLDRATFGAAALHQIVTAIGAMRRVRRIELETRLEFIRPEELHMLAAAAPRATLGILTGFETRDERIRDEILMKRESISSFLTGLDNVRLSGAALTAYVLFKPDPGMSDSAACAEAAQTIEFLATECARRELDLTIRLNPMYRAEKSRWARMAYASEGYAPPRLTDVMRVARQTAAKGIKIYVGLSAEGLADASGTYLAREDYDAGLIKQVKIFNEGHHTEFPLDLLGPPPEAEPSMTPFAGAVT